MATSRPSRRPDLEVHLGAGGLVVGHLHLGSGRRSAFSYDEGWLRVHVARQAPALGS